MQYIHLKENPHSLSLAFYCTPCPCLLPLLQLLFTPGLGLQSLPVQCGKVLMVEYLVVPFIFQRYFFLVSFVRTTLGCVLRNTCSESLGSHTVCDPFKAKTASLFLRNLPTCWVWSWQELLKKKNYYTWSFLLNTSQ